VGDAGTLGDGVGEGTGVGELQAAVRSRLAVRASAAKKRMVRFLERRFKDMFLPLSTNFQSKKERLKY
jgi:hypothetical protein